MSAVSLQAPRGTRDILAPDSTRLRALTQAFAAESELAGYGQVVSPMFEQIEVFRRVGEQTDIVSKEMYHFRDPGDRHLALRPELTASLARAFVQHRPPVPWKVWYEGPQFRYEKPQAGRFRQFNQVGVELFGSDDAQADVEVIALAWRFCAALGLRRVRSKSPFPLAIDEGSFSSFDVARAAMLDTADLVVLKVPKSGGVTNCYKSAVVAEAHGLGLLGSGLTDAGISFAAAIHLYSTLDLLLPPELNGPQFLVDMMADGLEIEGVTTTVPDKPGLGIDVPEAKLRENALKLG